jgi:hypothetical protein
MPLSLCLAGIHVRLAALACVCLSRDGTPKKPHEEHSAHSSSNSAVWYEGRSSYSSQKCFTYLILILLYISSEVYAFLVVLILQRNKPYYLRTPTHTWNHINVKIKQNKQEVLERTVHLLSLHPPPKFKRLPFRNCWSYEIKKYGVKVTFNAVTSTHFIEIHQSAQKLLRAFAVPNSKAETSAILEFWSYAIKKCNVEVILNGITCLQNLIKSTNRFNNYTTLHFEKFFRWFLKKMCY